MRAPFTQSLKLISDEPYRIFFPVALLVGVAGVLLWPLFYGGWLPYYPMFPHARMMIEGYVGGFAIGFLGTALPKMLGTRPLKIWQVTTLLTLHLSFCTLHLLNHVRVGDGLFALMVGFMLLWLFLRVKNRGTLPPPAMLVAGMGLLCGVFGASWSAAFALTGDIYWAQFAQRLLYQAFILLPLLGIGSFIFPMILGTPNKQVGLGGKVASKEWKKKAAESVLLGTLLILTYWVEVHGQGEMMSWTRVALCAVWITKESGWLTRKKAKGVMPFSLRAGIVCLLGSMVATGITRDYAVKIALEHMLYMGGFGLITTMVATRVIYGHSGQGEKFQKWIKPVTICTALLLLGMATRVSADFIPVMRISHHVYAAGCWILVSIIWGIAVLPSVKKRPFPANFAPKAPVKKSSVMDMNFRK